ncbi:MAG TPA: hypothetical protein VHQ20_02475 [Patescibacteria group bacterium]|jgi:hypothetical protein|nr:hypothetical protein [Patescibacteria group bacterium]
MKETIEKIRQRPDHHKDRIIWVTAAVAVAVLLIIWAIVGNGRRTTVDNNFFQTFNQDVQSTQTNIPDPLDVNANIDLNTNQ